MSTSFDLMESFPVESCMTHAVALSVCIPKPSPVLMNKRALEVQMSHGDTYLSMFSLSVPWKSYRNKRHLRDIEVTDLINVKIQPR